MMDKTRNLFVQINFLISEYALGMDKCNRPVMMQQDELTQHVRAKRGKKPNAQI